MFQNVLANILCFYVKGQLGPIFPYIFSFKLYFLQIWIFCENLGAPWNFSGCICANITKFSTDIETWHTTNLLSKIQFDWKVLEFWGVNLFSEWIVAMATLMIKTQFCSISLKCFLSRSMFLKTSSVGCILCFKFEGAEERFKNDSLCIC